MAWVVDTCILLDIGLDDPQFGVSSEHFLSEKLQDGLVICPVTFVELAPAFSGHLEALEDFLFHLGVDHTEAWLAEDTSSASKAWTRHIHKRRMQKTAKRPIADIFIGAFAQRFQGLLTRNIDDFRKLFPSLQLLKP
jgi:predicted nucleic acid-binding protein